jgi:hypothetical protein
VVELAVRVMPFEPNLKQIFNLLMEKRVQSNRLGSGKNKPKMFKEIMLDEYGNYVAIKLIEQARIFQHQINLKLLETNNQGVT